MGSCLVTDRGKEMKDYFVADKEIVTYESSDEAIEKIRYLQDHEEENEAVAGEVPRVFFLQATI